MKVSGRLVGAFALAICMLPAHSRDCITSSGESFQTTHPCWRIAEGARERESENQDVPASAAPLFSAPTQNFAKPSSSSKNYIRGPKGGCYYINGNGNKTYVDRSLC